MNYMSIRSLHVPSEKRMGITTERWSTLSNSGQLGTCENKWESRVAVIDSVGGKNRTSWELLSNSSCLILFFYIFICAELIRMWLSWAWLKRRKKPTKMNWSWCLVISPVCLACAAACTFVFILFSWPFGRASISKVFHLILFFFFLLAVFFNWGDRTRSRSSPFFLIFIDTERACPKLFRYQICARARSHFYSSSIQKQKRRKRKKMKANRGVWLRRAIVSCAWNEKRLEEAQIYLH